MFVCFLWPVIGRFGPFLTLVNDSCKSHASLKKCNEHFVGLICCSVTLDLFTAKSAYFCAGGGLLVWIRTTVTEHYRDWFVVRLPRLVD